MCCLKMGSGGLMIQKLGLGMAWLECWSMGNVIYGDFFLRIDLFGSEVTWKQIASSISGLMMTNSRREVMDDTPLIIINQVIVIANPAEMQNWMTFISPLQYQCWVVVGMTIVVCGVALTLSGHLVEGESGWGEMKHKTNFTLALIKPSRHRRVSISQVNALQLHGDCLHEEKIKTSFH